MALKPHSNYYWVGWFILDIYGSDYTYREDVIRGQLCEKYLKINKGQ